MTTTTSFLYSMSAVWS